MPARVSVAGRSITLREMSKLAVPIWVETVDQALRDAARAAEQGADLVELRLDHVAEQGEAAASLVQQVALPCIVTCRPTWEGGRFDGSEEDRIALWEAVTAGPSQPSYLDVELAAWQASGEVRERIGALVADPESATANAPGLILSSHDFRGRPRDLLRRLETMAGEPLCRVIKLAWQARSLRDNVEAFELLTQQVKPMIALCMGEFGLPTRVLAPKFGSLISFASLDEQTGSAPGQPTIERIKRPYRWDAIGPDTRVYGVIGYPIEHSMSPPLHNAGFAAVGEDAVYLPLPVHAAYEQFKATVGEWLAAERLDFRGASITLPHKENLIRFVEESGGVVEPLAASIGAANTLARQADDQLYASNTDYAAALDAVCAALEIERDQLAGRRVGVIGAGGASRAIVAGFARYGARVTVYNRTVDKAQTLAGAFGRDGAEVTASPLAELAGAPADVWINAASVGMYPDTDKTPVREDPAGHPAWGPGTVVFDTIYNPPVTRLLQQAEGAGCLTISGVEMFIRQAAAQFELWTARPAPLDIFRKTMEGELA